MSRTRKLLLALAPVVALLGGYALAPVLAQIPSLIISSPTGLEQIDVVVPSTGTLTTNPQKQQVTLNQIRNAAGYILVPTGTTVNTTVPNTAAAALATGAITTWNVTLPTAPYDGERVEVACPGGTATAAITATLPSGVAIVGTAFTACTSGGVGANTGEWQYSTSANTWYRIN